MEPVHEKQTQMIDVPRKDSDQPGYLPYLKSLLCVILSNPGMTHSVRIAFDECSGYRMGHAWVADDVILCKLQNSLS